jgi:hypothetical protein
MTDQSPWREVATDPPPPGDIVLFSTSEGSILTGWVGTKGSWTTVPSMQIPPYSRRKARDCTRDKATYWLPIPPLPWGGAV